MCLHPRLEGAGDAIWKRLQPYSRKLLPVRSVPQALALGASGTPAFFITGRLLSGSHPLDVFKQGVDEELAHVAEVGDQTAVELTVTGVVDGLVERVGADADGCPAQVVLADVDGVQRGVEGAHAAVQQVGLGDREAAAVDGVDRALPEPGAGPARDAHSLGERAAREVRAGR